MQTKPPSETPVVSQITVKLFAAGGRWEVTGRLHPARAMRLAMLALAERLKRKIW